MIEARNPIFGHFLVIDGRLAGVWRRDFKKDTVTITLKRFAPLSEAQEEAVHIAAERFGKFIGLVGSSAPPSPASWPTTPS
jgi:hypothetical protein